MKNIIRTIAQKILGYETYLFVFSVFNVIRRRSMGNDRGFMYFVNALPQKGAIIDIGANIGFTTVLLAKHWKGTTVYAVEPVPENIAALKKNVKYYSLSNVEVIETALGNNNGTVNMVVPVLFHARMQGLSHVAIDKTKNAFTVPLKRLDDIPAIAGLNKIVAIKIDVENYEYPVLQGARDLLQKHRPWVYCELMDEESRANCFAFMRELNYAVQVYEKGRLVDFQQQHRINFFFIPK